MRDAASTFRRRSRAVVGVLLGLAWVSVGIGVGWSLGFLADRLVLAAHRRLVVGTLGLCAVVLIAWVYGTRLLYLEIRAGVDEATAAVPTRRRTGHGYVAIAAAPIIAALIALSSSHLSSSHLSGGVAREAGTTTVTTSAQTVTSTGRDKQAMRATTSTYVVRPGDRLTGIAEHFYGSAADWPLIAKANAGTLHERSGARLIDPSLLPVGMELTIPGMTTTPATGLPATATHSDARATELFAALAGFGLLGAALFARHQRARRAYQAMRSPAGGRPPRLSEEDAAIEAQLRPLVAAELPEWIDAANRLLCASLLADRSIVPPTVSIVRAGPRGIELLLDEPCVVAPDGFLLRDGDRSLLLDPSLELAEIRDRYGPETQPFIAGLIPIAEDASGSYLVACGPGESLSVRGTAPEIARGLGAIAAHLADAPWGEVTLYRVGAVSFVGAEQLQELDVSLVTGLDATPGRDPLWRTGLAENQPIVLVEDPTLAAQVRAAAPPIVSVIGPLEDADRLVYFEDGMVTIGPLGLTLRALLPSSAELETVGRLQAAASAVPERSLEGSDARGSTEEELPEAGSVEVRILRGVPDIVGEVDPANVKADVVQLVAFLALHGRRATSAKLRDVFGVYRPDTSRRERTVWNATSRARQALGVDRFPLARGSQPYAISGEVTCDWLRFKEIVSIARALELAGEARRSIDALLVALELIGDGVPCSDDSVVGRYVWLDAEQFLVEMETTIVQAAHSLAMLSITHRPYAASLEDAAWAIERGRIISPDARPLREAAIFLADVREDTDAMATEFGAAVDAVDALELGEDIDPAIETLFQALSRANHSAPPPGADVP